MKYISILFVLFCFSACKSIEKISYSGEKYEVSNLLNQFLKQFELATVNHNKEKIISLLDEDYKKMRYSGLSQHEKEYFFREFYCGRDVKSNQAICPSFEEVDRIEFVSIGQNADLSYTVKYITHTIYEDLKAQWAITFKKQGVNQIYGIKPQFR